MRFKNNIRQEQAHGLHFHGSRVAHPHLPFQQAHFDQNPFLPIEEAPRIQMKSLQAFPLLS